MPSFMVNCACLEVCRPGSSLEKIVLNNKVIETAVAKLLTIEQLMERKDILPPLFISPHLQTGMGPFQ